MKPSQLISRANIDEAYDKLHEEHERLKRSHDFDAKRLRVLARVAGCEDGVPDDATAVACAGTVLGMIRRNVEQIVAARDALALDNASQHDALHAIAAVCEQFQNRDFDDEDYEELHEAAYQMSMDVVKISFEVTRPKSV